MLKCMRGTKKKHLKKGILDRKTRAACATLILCEKNTSFIKQMK